MAPPRDDTTEALEVRPFAFGAARSGGPALEQGEVTELDLLVEAISGAFELTGAATPRRPWPDPLAEHVVLADLPATGHDDLVPFPLGPDPAHQPQDPPRWSPASGHPPPSGHSAPGP